MRSLSPVAAAFGRLVLAWLQEIGRVAGQSYCVFDVTDKSFNMQMELDRNPPDATVDDGKAAIN